MKPKARIGKIAVALMIYGIVTIGFAALTSSLPLANATPLGTEQLTGISLDTPVIVGSMTIDNLGYDPANGVLSFGGGFADSLDLYSLVRGFNFIDLSSYFINGQASENGSPIPEIAFNNGQLYNPGPGYNGSTVINNPWDVWFQVNPALLDEFEQQLCAHDMLNLEVIRIPGLAADSKSRYPDLVSSTEF